MKTTLREEITDIMDNAIKEYKKEYQKEYNKEYQKKDKYKESHKKSNNKYYNQLCFYSGEILTLSALSMRFRRAGIENPTEEAKKYLLKKNQKHLLRYTMYIRK